MGWSSALRGAIERWQAMRELRSFQRDDASVNRWKFKDLLTDSRDAFERGLRTRALEIWNRAYALYPEIAIQEQAAIDLLFQLGLYDEAESLLNRGNAKYPNRLFYLENLALTAYERRDLPETIKRCEILHKKFPMSIKGDWIASAAFRQLGRFAEAEAILARGLRRNSSDVGLLIQHAQISELQVNWNEALLRWKAILDEYDHEAGAIGMALALTHLGRYEQAEKILQDATTKWGNSLSVWVGFVYIAEHKGDWEDVCRRWQTVRKRFPLEPLGYIKGVGPVLRLYGPAQADEILREGVNYIPDDPILKIEFALLAHRRGEWEEAARRWAELREQFPLRPEGYVQGAEALVGMGLHDDAHTLRLMAPAT